MWPRLRPLVSWAHETVKHGAGLLKMGRVDGQCRYSVECEDGQMSGVASSYRLHAMRLFSLLTPKCFKVDTSGTGELRHLRVLTSSTSTRPQHHADRHHGQLSCNQCLAWSPDNGTP
jgi:hypothetical protein